MKAEKIWLVHKGGFAAGKLQRVKSGADVTATAPADDATNDANGSSSSCKVKLDDTDTVLDVDEDDVEKVR